MAKIKKAFKKNCKLFSLSIIIVIFVVIITAGTTFAWLTDSGQATNDMHLADLQGKISGMTNLDTAQNPPIQHNVSVTNTNDSPVFVRVLVLPVCVIDGVSQEIEIGNQLSVDVNEDSWKYCPEDGYYYYTKKIMPGKSSDHIFTEVDFTSSMGTIYSAGTFALEFKAEFVGTTGYAYRTAWWQDQTPAGVWLAVDNILKDLVQQ